MSKLLLTGATGFIGRALAQRLLKDAVHTIVTATRASSTGLPSNIDNILVDDISSVTDWGEALSGVQLVIHAAGRAHKQKEAEDISLPKYYQTNTEGTLNLAHQAVNAGVSRFVFISSIGVVGNYSTRPLTEQDIPHPMEPYAISKFEAERGLSKIADETEMQVVIIRPPLVYGPGAPGNFNRLIRAASIGFPWPLGEVDNLRSFVSLDNLVDFIITCLEHPKAANQTFHISDGVDISTPDLLRLIGDNLGKRVRIFPIPLWMLRSAALLLGKKNEIERLCGTLQVDISKAFSLLEWEPPVSLDEGLRIVLEDYKRAQRIDSSE